MRVYYVPGIASSAFHALFHLFLTTTLCNFFFFFLQMTHEGIAAQGGCDQPNVTHLELGFEDLIDSVTHTLHP